MPTAGELERALFQLAPRDLAESWDNVGLLVGDCGREIHRALIALDVTAGTAAEAKEAGNAMDAAILSLQKELALAQDRQYEYQKEICQSKGQEKGDSR